MSTGSRQAASGKIKIGPGRLRIPPLQKQIEKAFFPDRLSNHTGDRSIPSAQRYRPMTEVRDQHQLQINQSWIGSNGPDQINPVQVRHLAIHHGKIERVPGRHVRAQHAHHWCIRTSDGVIPHWRIFDIRSSIAVGLSSTTRTFKLFKATAAAYTLGGDGILEFGCKTESGTYAGFALDADGPLHHLDDSP